MCFFCKGNLELGTTTHVVTLKNCIVIFKNVPCETCDQCGETYFSDDVMEVLENLLEVAKTIVSEVSIIDYQKIA